MNADSDDEVDLEALRLAALQTLHAKPKFTPHVNHSNLIPIVPVNVVAPIIVHPAVKLEPISPTLEENIQVNTRLDSPAKDEDKESLGSDSDQENEEDILSMDDKEEEDSLERLMDQLEAEISGKAPITSNRTVIAPKKPLNELKSQTKGKKNKKKDVEVELVEVKIGKQQGPVINIRESASPEPTDKTHGKRNSITPLKSISPKRNSRSPRRSRSRSPFRRSKSFRRSTSPYWTKSPRRSQSAKRSRSPFWLSRRSRSPFRKSRSPYRRSKSPIGRRRSPYRYSRTRSRSFDRRSRSPWSYSPRKRSRSPFYRDFSPFRRRRNIISPGGKSRKSSLSPRGKSRSPRRRSRTPRPYGSGRRSSPFHRSKSPLRRSRSPNRHKSPFGRIRSPYRSSTSPLPRRINSPVNPTDSPSQKRRSPFPPNKFISCRSRSLNRRSISPGRRPKSPSRTFRSSKSPGKKYEFLTKSKRSRSYSRSPERRNISPLRNNEKIKSNDNEQPENAWAEKRQKSLSKERRIENDIKQDRRPYRSRGIRRYSPSRSRRSLDRQRKRSRSPKKKVSDEKSKISEVSKGQVEDKGTSPAQLVPLDPILEARKKKFENLNEIDPTIDKKISLKSIKESSDNVPLDDDDDALNINLEGDLWDDSEESENEHESRFKTSEAKMKTNRTVLSFRNLRDDDSKKINLNKPLIEDNHRERYSNNRFDRWQRGRRNDRSDRSLRKRYRDSEGYRNKSEGNSSREKKSESVKSKSQDGDPHGNKKGNRKVIIFSSPKDDAELKDNEVSTTCNTSITSDPQTNREVSDNFDKLNGAKDKQEKSKVDARENDDFDKLISDFEKELESDICLPTKETDHTVASEYSEMKRLRISVKKDLLEPQPNPQLRKPSSSVSRSYEVSSVKDRGNRFDSSRAMSNDQLMADVKDSGGNLNQPEDYVEDDDFAIDEGQIKKRGKTSVEEEEGQNDLRDVLSRRRNERLTKAVSLQESMPARLVQSAFQGLGNKKAKRSVKEGQGSMELSLNDGSLKVAGTERRRVLLLQRKKPDVPSFKVTVPEVKPDTTIHQRLIRPDERKRSRILQNQLEVTHEVDQENEECFEAEEKQPRRVRLKRNVTLSSQPR